MSVKIHHLNGDTTFLLTFVPNDLPPPPNRYARLPGTFSILVDPWLSGPSSMWHPMFMLSKHTVPSAIQNLSHIPEPNVVLVSQDKPDHCHLPTLRQLDPSSTLTTILAMPAAAKKIRGMKHFDPSKVFAMPSFLERDSRTVIRFYIPPLTLGGLAGEATLSYIPAKLDVSGLHNAIGITYRPPTAAPLLTHYTPPLDSPSYSNFGSPVPPPPQNLPPTPPDSPVQRTRSLSSNTNTLTLSAVSTPLSQSTRATSHTSNSLSVSTISSTHSTAPPRLPKTLSIIYSPHGLSYDCILPYAVHHLVPLAALPLTTFLHSFDRVQNPWWLGGNVNAGLPGGVEIAKNLMAKCWISAHDEDKENSGLAVLKVATRKYTKEEVREMVSRESPTCDVRVLECGEEMIMKA
ncbi:MAG: hypothetical protein Q9167_006840 [Letrouitia subvulpina]